MAFDDRYLSPLKNTFTGYSGATMLTLLSHLYAHYAQILATYLAENGRNIRETYNPDEPLENLYTRVNECIDYTTVAGEPINEGQVVRIAYGIVAETGKFQEDCRTWRSKSEQEKTWASFQAHFIEAQADLRELQQTSRQGGYHTRTANNAMEMSVEFANLAHATAEDRVAVTNLTRENSTLTEQVALYANRISNKEADNIALQAYMRNLQGEIKNLKTKMYSLKKSRHSGGAGAANKDNGRIAPSRKREGPYHHPTWWSTTYCWSHGAGGHT